MDRSVLETIKKIRKKSIRYSIRNNIILVTTIIEYKLGGGQTRKTKQIKSDMPKISIKNLFEQIE